MDDAAGQSRLVLLLAGGVRGALLVVWFVMPRLSRSAREWTSDGPAIAADR